VLLASGKLQGADDAQLSVTTVEGVLSLGLGRTDELVLAHVVSLKQDLLDLRLRMDERLRAIELRLEAAQRGDSELDGSSVEDGGEKEVARGRRSPAEDEPVPGGYESGLETSQGGTEIGYDKESAYDTQEGDGERDGGYDEQESDYVRRGDDSERESGGSLYDDGEL
jgi:hypothetical protein